VETFIATPLEAKAPPPVLERILSLEAKGKKRSLNTGNGLDSRCGGLACFVASHLGGTMAGENIIAEAVRKLNRLEFQIKDTRKHVQFLRTLDFLDARELQRIAHELRVGAMAMEEYLLRAIGEAEQVARRYPARPFRAKTFGQQVTLNAGLASAVGYRNELRALSKRVPQELDELHKDVHSLAEKAKAGLNEPGRWGDLSISSPITDVIGFVFSALELIAKYAEKRRAARRASPALR